jgi:uncharacterized membrane protein YhaH (DUF805 family)
LIWILTILFCAPFVALGLMVLGSSNFRSLIFVIPFGLFGAVGAVGLIRPARLEVGPEGLTQTVLGRKRTVAWTDAYNFRPVVISLTSKMIGFDYLKPPRRGLTQGRLAGNWENPPEAVANLLNQAREHWLVGAEVATQPLPTPQPQSPFAAALNGTRINRKAFWLASVTIFGIVIVLSFIPPLRGFVRYLTLFLFIRVYAARLHDFGRSAWWQAIMYVLQFALVIALSLGARHQFGVAILAGFLVQLTFTILLGVIPGDRSANRFGPPPDQPDLSPTAVSETFR